MVSATGSAATHSQNPVSTSSGRVLGWVALAPVSDRCAYAGVAEDSIYVAPEAQGRGVGKALLAQLLQESEALGARQMLAVIGDSANASSIGVHRALGFEHTGLLKASGWKFDAWRDVVIMQRALGRGDQSPPPEGA